MWRFISVLLGLGLANTSNGQTMQQAQMASLNERMNQMINALYSTTLRHASSSYSPSTTPTSDYYSTTTYEPPTTYKPYQPSSQPVVYVSSQSTTPTSVSVSPPSTGAPGSVTITQTHSPYYQALDPGAQPTQYAYPTEPSSPAPRSSWEQYYEKYPYTEPKCDCSQYSPPTTQYGCPNQYAQSPQYAPTSQQYAPPTQQYPSPTQQYAAPTQQYAAPTQQYSSPTQQYAPPTQQYAPSTQQCTPPSQQYAQPAQQCSPPPQQYAQPAPTFGQPPQPCASQAQHYSTTSQQYVSPPQTANPSPCHTPISSYPQTTQYQNPCEQTYSTYPGYSEQGYSYSPPADYAPRSGEYPPSCPPNLQRPSRSYPNRSYVSQMYPELIPPHV